MPMNADRAPRAQRVVVAGAGIAGLVSAALLAARGLDVQVVEAGAAVGGKMRRIEVAGAGIDSGPTVFTMRWVFDAVFEALGTRLEDELKVSPLQVLASHTWRGRSDEGDDATGLNLYADRERSAEAVGEFAGAAEARAFRGFCDEARKLYATLESPYIRSPRPTFWRMVHDLGPSGLATLASLGPLATLSGRLAHHFRDPRLRQLFARYATYTGSSPGMAPATLMLIAQVELDGVWRVEGGLHAVAQRLQALAEAAGARFRFGRAVREVTVRGGRACGVVLADGEALSCDHVIWNGDVNALASGLAGPDAAVAARPVPPRERSLSALTWSMHTAAGGPAPLTMHNVFFDRDYASEFADIFGQRRLPRRGTVYVCAQDRGDDSARLDGPPLDLNGHLRPERLLALVNAPATGDLGPGHRAALSEEEIDRCEQRSFQLLRACGLRLSPSAHQVVRTSPIVLERLFPATGGALYGRASHGWMAQFKRAGAASRLPGLWTAGGSVHPGPGVPMAAMSGRLAAEALMAHLDSTSRFRVAATSGGTSTRSATTTVTPSP